jgi:glycosyltransferase involved in cell wall biosynthesis
MKILIWNTNFLRDGGGSQKVAHYLACDLHRSGIQATVACNRVNEQERNAVFGDLPPGVALYQGTFVNLWESPEGPASFVSKSFSYLSAAVRFFSFMRKEKFSHIHLNYVSWDIVLLGLCARLLNIPLVVSFLGGETNLAPQRRLTRLKVKLALRVADRVTAVSVSACDELKNSFGFQDVLHIPFFYDSSEQLQPGCVLPATVEEDQFVFCGRVSPEKRLPFLVQVFHEATVLGCSRKLFVIGGGEDMAECRQLVDVLKLQDQVIFLGLLPFQVAQQIISKCRCLILCSRTESNPQVVLEAMSFERPVICSMIPGVEQIVLHKKTGLIFEMTRKDILAESILRVSTDEAYARKLGCAAGAHFKALFSESSFSEQMLAVYSQLPPTIHRDVLPQPHPAEQVSDDTSSKL